MKALNFEQMEIISGGNDRACMIAGGLAFGLVVAGFKMPAFWGVAAVVTTQAAFNGCFG